MHSKLFLENNKKKISCSSFIFQPSAAQDALNRLGSACLARTGRTQAATWASTWPSASRASVLIRRPSVRFARSKPPPRPVLWKTLAHSPLLSLSLLRRTLSSLFSAAQPQPRASDDERAGLCAVAGPLAGARAPQRVSTPPSSGPGRGASLAEPGEPAPPARLLLPRRRKSSSDAP